MQVYLWFKCLSVYVLLYLSCQVSRSLSQLWVECVRMVPVLAKLLSDWCGVKCNLSSHVVSMECFYGGDV